MIKIAITPENLSDGLREANTVRTLLDAGWDRVHLRHPAASLSDMKRLIEAIPQSFHKRLVIHGHFDLCNYFNLGGLHLNSRCPEPPARYNGALSRSCHSVEEILTARNLVYATLSPVFDSISKEGYRSPFTSLDFEHLQSAQIPVIALGGVTVERIDILKRYNFSGFAMLGAIPWNSSEETIRQFTKKL